MNLGGSDRQEPCSYKSFSRSNLTIVKESQLSKLQSQSVEVRGIYRIRVAVEVGGIDGMTGSARQTLEVAFACDS